MISYHGKEELKAWAIEHAENHAKQDMLLAGTYGKMIGHFKGCSVGCDAYDITGEVCKEGPHKITAEYFGFPEWLEYLRDTFFEALPEEKKSYWHVELKKAIPVGLNEIGFNKIKAKFLIHLLKGNIERVEALSISDDLKKQVIDAISQCLSLQERAAISGQIDESAAESARSAAESAAESAARAAAGSAWSARSAAGSAAESARSAWAAESAAESARSAWEAESAARAARSAWAAESAARAARSAWEAWAAESAARSAWAAWAAAESAARSAAYEEYADVLLRLFKEAANISIIQHEDDNDA